MTEEEKAKKLKEDRITVHAGEFTIGPMTEDTHSLTPEEYRKKKLAELEELKKIMQKKKKKKNLIKNVTDSVWGFVTADALGVPVEFKNREDLVANPVTDMLGYGTYKVPAGTWSDDSSMVLATMDSIISRRQVDLGDIMSKFCDWFMHSKYTGTGITFDIGMTTRKALINYYNGKQPLECGMRGEMDNGNGSLMRILPIVLYSFYNDLEESKEVELIHNVSSLTHGHEISFCGCKIYSDYMKEILNGQTKEAALEIIKANNYKKYYSEATLAKYSRILVGDIKNESVNNIKSSGFVVDSLEASLWCVLNSSGYEEAVQKAVNLGGDTDTIAAITGSIAGVIYGRENIPEKWQTKINNKELLNNIIDGYHKLLAMCMENKLTLDGLKNSKI